MQNTRVGVIWGMAVDGGLTGGEEVDVDGGVEASDADELGLGRHDGLLHPRKRIAHFGGCCRPCAGQHAPRVVDVVVDLPFRQDAERQHQATEDGERGQQRREERRRRRHGAQSAPPSNPPYPNTTSTVPSPPRTPSNFFPRMRNQLANIINVYNLRSSPKALMLIINRCIEAVSKQGNWW